MRVVCAALVCAALVGAPGCRLPCGTPGFEFRVFRPAVAFEPRLVEEQRTDLRSLGLSGAAPVEVDEEGFPVIAPPNVLVRPRQPRPRTFAPDDCYLRELLEMMRRIEARLPSPERIAPPRARVCPPQ